MEQVLDIVRRVAAGRSTVLITGEIGTGKERIARALHDLSDRKDKPFLVVNCGAIPASLVESELFGHEKGAFTGAANRSLGIFRTAEGGSVFLDEVGELPAPMQVKLLRVLQERKVRGIGETEESSIDVRVLAATNRQVEEDVKAGTFRQDLYYRLNVIRVALPPLRERREDVPELARHFLERCSHEHGKAVRAFSPDALRALDAYDFPGNVRELENIVERAVTLSDGPLMGASVLPPEIAGVRRSPGAELHVTDEGIALEATLDAIEKRLLVEALEKTGGKKKRAGELLGLTFRSLRYRLQKHGLGGKDDDEEES
jgi:two-component system response regulator PilR (NtrC family)